MMEIGKCGIQEIVELGFKIRKPENQKIMKLSDSWVHGF
jgi:hypothetical protein